MSALARLGRTRKGVVALSLAAASVLAIAFGLLRGTPPLPPARAAAAAAAPAAPRCRFGPGETAAFRLESTVRDVRGDEADELRATLSWQVAEQLSPASWRLRAALSGVRHTQALTLPEERVKGPLTDPFLVDVDASCRFVGFGFPRGWDARRRQLVQTMLRTHEFVLPESRGARRWSASQTDGMGPFEARYELAPGARGAELRLQRRKAAYDGKARADALGLSVVVVGSEATATFDGDHPSWLTATSGVERVRILVQRELQADLLQQFRLTRDDARFVAMAALASEDADFRDAFELEAEPADHVDPEVARLSYDEALQAFLAHFRGATTGDPSYAAARQLAAWLKAHPEAAHRLVAALRAGTIAEAARSALFLGLELSGTEPARAALAEVIVEPRFRSVDRARAASALSDIGAPSRETAELLLSRAREDRDEMVANVSLLGLGSMARRSGDDELKTYVRASLDDKLATATSEGETRLVLDAMGNSGDPAFAGELEEHLGAESPSTRQHAAEALGRLDPAEAGPRLLDQLRDETDPAVGAAIVGAYHAPPTPEAIALMSDRLAASPSIPERAALIAWLGAASRAWPEALSRLVAQFHRETSVRLMQQIGAFVPAAALR